MKIHTRDFGFSDIILSQIQDMESEAKMAPINYRTQMLSHIRNFRGDLEQMTRTLVWQCLILDLIIY